ncbi:hypothetical protein RGUI_3323 [Rhodovulum sp. P5]|uniref:CBS domain-containing protein n=1 Tax=Rhodovulum sp. P5 TaxID=1564506 RepID=UPI0009C3153E|nr:CBS domain-containing protein [Rhodovulum sp. P5]ARE41464.1 hypothetical protein RGUI_3323 [Rhodovulum sp. P5]
MTGRQFTSVAEVMSQKLQTINGLATVQQAIDQMKEARVGSLIIERRHDGDEFGLVTVYDIAAKVVAENRSFDRVSVYEIMTKPVVTVSADMNIKYAIRLLARLCMTRALVTKGDELVGIVTQRDMVVRFADDSHRPA